MPTYRVVSKTDAATPEAAAKFILDDTGGVVQHASSWPIIEEGDCWRVPVFSTDGKASMPFPVGAVFPKDNRASNSEIDRQIHQFDLKERRELTARVQMVRAGNWARQQAQDFENNETWLITSKIRGRLRELSAFLVWTTEPVVGTVWIRN